MHLLCEPVSLLASLATRGWQLDCGHWVSEQEKRVYYDESLRTKMTSGLEMRDDGTCTDWRFIDSRDEPRQEIAQECTYVQTSKDKYVLTYSVADAGEVSTEFDETIELLDGRALGFSHALFIRQ